MSSRNSDKFACGHYKTEENSVIQQRLYFSKTQQKLLTCKIRSCRVCHNAQNAKWQRENKERKTNKRWKLVNGKRKFYIIGE